jgi:hypothetical protein
MCVRVNGWLFRLDIESKQRFALRYPQEVNSDDFAISGLPVHSSECARPFCAQNRRRFPTPQLKVRYQCDWLQIDLQKILKKGNSGIIPRIQFYFIWLLIVFISNHDDLLCSTFFSVLSLLRYSHNYASVRFSGRVIIICINTFICTIIAKFMSGPQFPLARDNGFERVFSLSMMLMGLSRVLKRISSLITQYLEMPRVEPCYIEWSTQIGVQRTRECIQMRPIGAKRR